MQQVISPATKNQTNALFAEYSYDHEGNRIRKIEYRGGNQSNNETTIYVSDSFVVIINSSGTFNYTYYYLNDQLVAAKAPDGAKTYYHSDHLGSTTLVTNQSGDIVEENFYEPFGEIYSGNESSRYLYTGQELDQDTDLYYYGARYYDPSIPLFIQPDPLIQDIYTPADLNRYAYVRNNPYKYTDPSGNFAFYFGIQGQIGALIGATSSGGLVITYSPSQGFQVGVYDKIGKGGVTTPTLSAAFESGIAPLVNSLSEFEGSSYDAGFDIGEGASAGFGISLPRTNEGTISLNGASLEGSATLTDANLPLPASAYATISETSTICFFGCKDKEIKKIKLSNIREYLSIEQLYKLNAKTKTTGGAIYSEVKSEEDSEKDKEKDNKCGATMSCTGRQ